MVKAFVLVVVVVVGMAAGMYSLQAAEYESAFVSKPLGWMLASDTSLSPETRGIDVLYKVPDCGYSGTLSTKIEYRPTEVALGLILKYQPGCLMSGGTAHVQFDLSEPLGTRHVVPLDQPNLTLEDFAGPPHPATADPAFAKDQRL